MKVAEGSLEAAMGKVIGGDKQAKHAAVEEAQTPLTYVRGNRVVQYIGEYNYPKYFRKLCKFIWNCEDCPIYLQCNSELIQ